jgi:pyridoxal phosphate enzyme (YggS family)
MDMETIIKKRLSEIGERIKDAAGRSGRSPADIHLIVVTKRVSANIINILARIGVKDIGENYVQDAMAKRKALASIANEIRWHMIGHLQRNKAKKALEVFDILHSLDSLNLAVLLLDILGERKKRLPVFIEVKTSEEATKFGTSSEEAFRIAEFLLSHTDVFEFMGLMTMAPYSENPESARRYFAGLRALRDKMQERFGRNIAPYLSMGMSSDFEVAIEEGATHLRIGDAITGGLEGN